MIPKPLDWKTKSLLSRPLAAKDGSPMESRAMDARSQFSDGGVTDARCGNHRRGGGSIPASSLFFQSGRTDEVATLIKSFHYSRRVPANVQFVGTLHERGGLFGDSGRIVAGLCFSIPPTRWSEDVLELSRLVRREDTPGVPLSLLIRLASSRVRQSGADLLVSFADVAQRHHGGIYQAAGWNYSGRRERTMDGLIIEGRFVPGRSCNSSWGTRSPSRISDRLPEGVSVEPHYDEGKHIYWKALGRNGERKAERLGLNRMAYPKPTKA